ncbi:MFS transporter [Motilibacter aurantiacus]|uniref:MFS transporter n=1 Tax=Motilibacter aurantiacus TaxID=2714955 RepID=UPI00140A31EA|nr:MFS transporter [Motilibacter aurantiacus]NHC47174.1 MFS transporter [Motilibacter aurantiacus]
MDNPRSGAGSRLARTPAFWLVSASLLVLTAAASAPSPLYVVYQERWGFSSLTLTAVFAVYAVALLAALLTVGGLSDFLGRKPMLVVGLVLDAAAMAVFLAADGVAWLVAARVVQGVAIGASLGVLSAYLIDLQPRTSPKLGALVNSAGSTVGLAAGALLAGVLVEYAPAPSQLVYAVLGVALLLLVPVALVLPETVSRAPGALASLRPRVAVPAAARRAFLVAAPVVVATWAMGGLYLSLGPSLAVGVFGLDSHLVGGVVVATLMAPGALASVAMRDAAPRSVMRGGAGVLVLGTAATLLAIDLSWAPLFFVGTAIAGLGFGSAFLGAFKSLVALAAPHERAELFSAVFVVSYLAFSIPAVVAGLAVPSAGLRATATAYGLVVIVLALVAALPRPAQARELALSS